VSERDEELLARAATTRLQGIAYRNQPPGFDPRSGAGARRRGGRFNPPNSFPVLYLAVTPDTAAAELHRAAEGMGLRVAAVLPRELYRYDVDLVRVLDLRDRSIRDALGVTLDELLAADRTRSHQIGEAASRLGVQALVCPSATGVGDVLAVFVDNLGSATCDPHLAVTWTTEDQIGTEG
jgi:RES domain-containing protein